MSTESEMIKSERAADLRIQKYKGEKIMEKMREQAREFITLLRSNLPEDREKAAIVIFQAGMLAQKRVMQPEQRPDGNDRGSRRSA